MFSLSVLSLAAAAIAGSPNLRGLNNKNNESSEDVEYVCSKHCPASVDWDEKILSNADCAGNLGEACLVEAGLIGTCQSAEKENDCASPKADEPNDVGIYCKSFSFCDRILSLFPNGRGDNPPTLANTSTSTRAPVSTVRLIPTQIRMEAKTVGEIPPPLVFPKGRTGDGPPKCLTLLTTCKSKTAKTGDIPPPLTFPNGQTGEHPPTQPPTLANSASVEVGDRLPPKQARIAHRDLQGKCKTSLDCPPGWLCLPVLNTCQPMTAKTSIRRRLMRRRPPTVAESASVEVGDRMPPTFPPTKRDNVDAKTSTVTVGILPPTFVPPKRD